LEDDGTYGLFCDLPDIFSGTFFGVAFFYASVGGLIFSVINTLIAALSVAWKITRFYA